MQKHIEMERNFECKCDFRLRFSEKTGPTENLIAAGERTEDGKDVRVDGASEREGKEGGDRNEDHILKEETSRQVSNRGAQVKLLSTNNLNE